MTVLLCFWLPIWVFWVNILICGKVFLGEVWVVDVLDSILHGLGNNSGVWVVWVIVSLGDACAVSECRKRGRFTARRLASPAR